MAYGQTRHRAWLDGWMGRWIHGSMGRSIDGSMDQWIDGGFGGHNSPTEFTVILGSGLSDEIKNQSNDPRADGTVNRSRLGATWAPFRGPGGPKSRKARSERKS